MREDVKMRRCEDEKVKMRRCEDEKMRYRPALLEEPCAQTLSGKKVQYHDAVNDTRYLILFWEYPTQSI